MSGPLKRTREARNCVEGSVTIQPAKARRWKKRKGIKKTKKTNKTHKKKKKKRETAAGGTLGRAKVRRSSGRGNCEGKGGYQRAAGGKIELRSLSIGDRVWGEKPEDREK